jgi:hypothetical protein
MCTPLVFYQHLFSLNHPLTQPHFTQPLVTQPMLCAVHPTPRLHPCYPPTMSHPKPFSPLYPIITPTLHDHPRTNLVPWKMALNRSARAVFAEWDQYGFLFGVCDDAVWVVLNTPPGGPLQARPDFPAPADLAPGDGPAVRDDFKRATDARASWLACSAAFCAAILDNIGESNCLAISDPDTDTLHLSPRNIINAMTALHGTMTGAEVDALRLPLQKKLAALADLPAHIVTFRGHLARLNTAGQAPLALDAYRLFLASLSPFTVLHQYTLLFTVQNGAIGQQTFEAYTAYLLGQHSNILAHSNLRPFAGNIEGYEDGASEDDGMGWDSLYQTFSPPSNPQYPTANAMQPYYPPHQPYPPQQFLPPPPGLGFNPYPYPMANGFYPYPSPAVAPAPAYSRSDKKGNRQKGNKKDKKGQTPPKAKTGTPNTNLPRTSLSRPSKLHFYCHFHGWVTTHGWPSGNGGHHGDTCLFMKSRPSEFTPPMLAAPIYENPASQVRGVLR